MLRELLLATAMLLLIAYGYFLMKKTDEFLEENSEYEEASENEKRDS